MTEESAALCDTCQKRLQLSSTPSSQNCSICLNVWTLQEKQFQEAIQQACQSYGGVAENEIDSVTVAISGDVCFRYSLAYDNTDTALDYLGTLKNHVKQLIQSNLPTSSSSSNKHGSIGLHVMIAFDGAPRPNNVVLPKRKKRKRFRGVNILMEPLQGGDPRVNLQERLGDAYWNPNEIATLLKKAHPALKQEWQNWFRHQQQQQTDSETVRPTIHVAAWRNPIYIKGMYTKSRRDVSQTPFYVVRDGKSVRLGVTSVQEEICPHIERACRGISCFNNNNDSNVVYGMCKFHASGREDMDVRMILPDPPQEGVGGRPFCCQVFDAHHVPSRDELQETTNAINNSHISGETSDGGTNKNDTSKDIKSNESIVDKPEQNEHVQEHRRYGQNPLGVDVSSLILGTASDFSNLQAETEAKVKHYECLCWCETSVKDQDDLERQLCSETFPLKLQQQTPLRVLHRRANATRVRHVLTLQPVFISSNWFRLHLSTEAGTYVKEFVHGDLGRTTPSVASLLQCKTDILELDCEGIAMS